MGVKEKGLWRVNWKVEKYEEDIGPFEPPRGRLGQFIHNIRRLPTEEMFHRLFTPYEVILGEGNLLLNEGINALWDLVCGAAGTAYSNANARIGVGNSATAAAATDTGLLGGSSLYKAMEATFPTSGTSQKVTFKSSFGTGEANFAWNEWTIDNGAAASKNLNRKVESLGTKSGGTWTLTVEVTLS